MMCIFVYQFLLCIFSVLTIVLAGPRKFLKLNVKPNLILHRIYFSDCILEEYYRSSLLFMIEVMYVSRWPPTQRRVKTLAMLFSTRLV